MGYLITQTAGSVMNTGRLFHLASVTGFNCCLQSYSINIEPLITVKFLL